MVVLYTRFYYLSRARARPPHWKLKKQITFLKSCGVVSTTSLFFLGGRVVFFVVALELIKIYKRGNKNRCARTMELKRFVIVSKQLTRSITHSFTHSFHVTFPKSAPFFNSTHLSSHLLRRSFAFTSAYRCFYSLFKFDIYKQLARLLVRSFRSCLRSFVIFVGLRRGKNLHDGAPLHVWSFLKPLNSVVLPG